MSGIALQVPNGTSGEWYASQDAEEAVQIDTGRGVLWSLYVTNVNAADRYLWVFDSLASSGTVHCGPFKIAAGDGLGLNIGYGKPYETGLRVAASSTHAAFTASAGADFRINAGFGPNVKRKDQ
jgi:hypothetical protein